MSQPGPPSAQLPYLYLVLPHRQCHLCSSCSSRGTSPPFPRPAVSGMKKARVEDRLSHCSQKGSRAAELLSVAASFCCHPPSPSKAFSQLLTKKESSSALPPAAALVDYPSLGGREVGKAAKVFSPPCSSIGRADIHEQTPDFESSPGPNPITGVGAGLSPCDMP